MEGSVTTISWIPAEAVDEARTGFRLGTTRADSAPPDELGPDIDTTLDDLSRTDRFRFANHLRAFADFDDDGEVVRYGQQGSGRLGQTTLSDAMGDRTLVLGGVSIAMAADVAETTLIPRPPRGRESVPVQVSRLLHAHEIVLKEARTMARLASEREDDGTNDLIVSDVIRTNELQVWLVAEHVVDTPVIRAE